MSSSFDVDSDQLCYVHCDICTTILMVSVPCTSLFEVVTVRCGQCNNLLCVNMANFLSAFKTSVQQQTNGYGYSESISSSNISFSNMSYVEYEVTTSSTKKLEKKPRAPSMYNCFIKEEIQRLKAKNPGISHKQAFSTAAKNWAHNPQFCGSVMENYKQGKVGGEVLSSKTL